MNKWWNRAARPCASAYAASILLCAAPAHALVVADSADDVCALAADPCIVSQEVAVVDGSFLDFGTRVVQVQSGGVFDFATGSGTIACGRFTASVSGNAVKASGIVPGGGTAGGTVTILARRRCSGNASVPCLNDADCMAASAGLCTSGDGTISLGGKIAGNADVAARITLQATGDIDILQQITVATTDSVNSGGTISILSEHGSIQVSDKLDLTCGLFGRGGELLLGAGLDIHADALIDANGGDFDGGSVSLDAGRDISITDDILANSINGAGFGGEIDVYATGNLSIVGGSATNRLNLSTDGHLSSENIAGDGGQQLYEAGGTIIVSEFVRFDANGALPDGYGDLVAFTALGDIDIAGQILSKGKGSLGGGGSIEILTNSDLGILPTASLDATGQAAGGGDISLEADGDLVISGSIDASGGNGGVAGVVFADAGTDATVTGSMVTRGASAFLTHGELIVQGCRVVVSGSLANTSELGRNVLVGRERITVSSTGSMTATGSGGSNTLRYRAPGKPPIVQGAVSPAPILTVDPALIGCPVCGNGEIDQDESCDDGNLTGGDGCGATCQDEGCIAQTPGYPATRLCDDSNQCTDDSCNAGNHACVHSSNGCSDGIACTTDSCAVNVCTHAPVDALCGDNNPCTANTCSTVVGCVVGAQAGPCDDGVFCNGTDNCNGTTCSAHAGDPCAAGAECADFCNEAADACLTPVGTACSDDGNPCTNDACNGAGSCIHPNNSAPCQDGLFCNGTDTCVGGSCESHAGDPCASGGECTNVCNEAGDHCLAPAGTPCSDEGNDCTDDACSASGSCAHAPNANSCDDLNFCTVDDVCSGGVCSATPAPALGIAGLRAKLRPDIDDDRGTIKGSFPISALAVSPVDVDVRVLVSEPAGSVLYEATIPTGSFEESRSGAVFRFKAESPADAGGILKASLKAVESSGLVKLKFKIGEVDLTGVVAAGALSVAVVFGDEPGSSPCTSSTILDCEHASSRISCKNP